jgi:hypothetical protein
MVLRDVDILEERLNSETDRPNKKNIIECSKLQAERGGAGGRVLGIGYRGQGVEVM